MESWRNWAGNLESKARVEAPRDCRELCGIVLKAATNGERVRATGGSYSWAPLVPPQGNHGTIVKMHHLDQLIAVDVEGMKVEVECGMTIETLNQIVTEKGLTLISPTLFPLPTVGGVIATACHGTGRAGGNFSDNILEMKVVTRYGTIERIDADHPDFHAYQVSLGALGIIYSVTLKLAPQFNVRTEVIRIPVERVLAEFDDLRASSEFLEIFWWPFQDTMSVYCMNRTTTIPQRQSKISKLFARINQKVQTFAAGVVLPWIAGHLPNFTPYMSTLSERIGGKEGVNIQTASDAFHFQKVYPKCFDMSYSFPAEDAEKAWRGRDRPRESLPRCWALPRQSGNSWSVYRGQSGVACAGLRSAHVLCRSRDGGAYPEVETLF